MRRVATLIIFFLVFFFICPLHAASQENSTPLVILYFEQAPYYYEQKGEITGFLMDKSALIFRLAGIPVTYHKVPPKRILSMIQTDQEAYCSIGWFKNPQREMFAKFTSPIYQDLPFELLIRKEQKDRFLGYTTFRALLNDTRLIFGATQGYSYGRYVDQLLQQYQPRIETTNNNLNTLKMLASGRVDFMLVSPEIIDMLAEQAKVDRDQLETIALHDIPNGNKRYIMCSQKVPDQLIETINRTVQSLPPVDRH